MPKYDETRCNHQKANGEGFIHRVSSLRDGDPDFLTKPLRSAWVCGDRSCTLDAQAWALRAGSGEVYTYASKDHECDMCEPFTPAERVGKGVTLIERAARS